MNDIAKEIGIYFRRLFLKLFFYGSILLILLDLSDLDIFSIILQCVEEAQRLC